MSLEYIYLFYITGTGDIIAVMITELRGKDILSYLEKNISVQMTIAVGTRMPPKNFSRGSLVFVSISFIVLMIISSFLTADILPFPQKQSMPAKN